MLPEVYSASMCLMSLRHASLSQQLHFRPAQLHRISVGLRLQSLQARMAAHWRKMRAPKYFSHHVGYNLDINKLGNFTPFLQSAVKPDLLFQEAQKQLAADSQLWVDWYNYTALTNRQFMSPNALKKQAMDVQATLLGSAGSQVHYVCTTTYSLNTTSLTIYRLTYILPKNNGYADLYFLVEGSGNSLGYL